MRLVLDTNILVSGLLSDKAPPGKLLSMWDEGEPWPKSETRIFS